MEQSDEAAAEKPQGKPAARRDPKAKGTGPASRASLQAVRRRKQDAKDAAPSSRVKSVEVEGRGGRGGKAARGDGAGARVAGAGRGSPKQGMIDPEKNTRVREGHAAGGRESEE